MLLEYLFFDKSKRPQVETFNEELTEQWKKENAKKNDLPPQVTYKDFSTTDYWIVKYEKDGNSEVVAVHFSKINRRICEEFSPTILTDESSEYFNKSLYPLVNKFERQLRKLLYLKVSLSNEEKLKKTIQDIEKKDFGDIYNILFVDSDFRSKAREKIKKLDTRAEMFEAIEDLNEQTAWDILIGNSVLTKIKDNFDLLKEYRNDVMHAHNIDYDKFKTAKKLFSDVNLELEEQINAISPTTIVSPKTIDILYDKLESFKDETTEIANGISRFLDFFATLSKTTIPLETLSNWENTLKLLGSSTELSKTEKLLSGFSPAVRTELPQSNRDNEDEMSAHK